MREVHPKDNGSTELGKNEFIHICGLKGFFLAACDERSNFRGIIRANRSDKLEELLNPVISGWKKSNHFDPQNILVKFIAPHGSQGIIEDYFNKNKIQCRGRYYALNEKIELYFQGIDGRLRVSGLSSSLNMPANLGASKNNKKIRLMIVDDSETVHKILEKIIADIEDIEIVAQARKPSEVRGYIERTKPDVMTLDINMPEMDGVQLLKSLPEHLKIPAVVVSSINFNEGTQVLEALECGAVDYIHKPSFEEIHILISQLGEKLRVAANQKNRMKKRKAITTKITPALSEFDWEPGSLISIGSSTGGTEAIREILEVLPTNMPPIVITQHIPPIFSKAFADRLNKVTDFRVKEAEDGDLVRAGEVLIAPGEKQMEVVAKVDDAYRVRVYDGEKVSNHKPSVDVLFRSVAKLFPKTAVGILLTGMGKDGAEGLLEMKKAGSFTIAQNEESCVVYGMPRAAVLLNAHCEEIALNEIPKLLVGYPQLVAEKKVS